MSNGSALTTLSNVADTSAPGCELVRQWLREYNWAANSDFMARMEQPENRPRTLVLLANTDSEIVGGLFAETQLAWLRISIVAVDPNWRSQGVGTALLREAEREAIVRECKYAYVDTMDYQAQGFYVAQGFTQIGEIPDWDSCGHSKLYFSKHLR